MQKGSAATFPTLTVSLGWILQTITLGLGYSSAIINRLHNLVTTCSGIFQLNQHDAVIIHHLVQRNANVPNIILYNI